MPCWGMVNNQKLIITKLKEEALKKLEEAARKKKAAFSKQFGGIDFTKTALERIKEKIKTEEAGTVNKQKHVVVFRCNLEVSLHDIEDHKHPPGQGITDQTNPYIQRRNQNP